ncbi:MULTISPECIES: TIR domain-containing protein [unclassified Bradyrhizobium]|uniref:TIR domain-containing protein n=1 Tax=unclassified Bradyrhizobium TaxID=2631580 RepID=UPI002916B9C0|nr:MULTISPECIES: TIR domain-containing protein [unclassified Bradyrhizobium]
MALTPSQRISLKKEIADRLQQESYPLIDATLKEFDLPTSEEWSGEKHDYLLEMLKSSPDQILIDLASHVGFNFEETVTPSLVAPAFWQNGMLRVFLSHLAVHKVKAAKLQEAFLEFGISCFVAHTDIEPTATWQTEIETALATCDALIALLHPGFHASDWTDQEIGFAMGRGLPIFSVRVGEDPYGFIGRFQAFNAKGKETETLAREIFDAFRKNKQTEQRMSEVLVGMFEHSRTFAEAKSRIGLLEDIKAWRPTFSSRLLAAIDANSQISGSWGVPERAMALVKKWKK